MKKNGFTMAEVLITLGIIGVVAAITLPSLMTHVGDAQVGPKLAKAVSMFEQGNEALLYEHNVDMISDDDELIGSMADYGDELSNHLKITAYTGENYAVQNEGNGCDVSGSYSGGTKFLAKDGMIYSLNYEGPDVDEGPAHKQRIGTVYIDINGPALPNSGGSDIFAFGWYNDGSLRPVGASNWNENGDSCSWRNLCAEDSVPTDYYACTGSVFENDLKVLYK